MTLTSLIRALSTRRTHTVRRIASLLPRHYTSASEPQSLAKVRNIGIIAHIDAGKTTTTERMLHYAGFTRSIGDVDDGDTIMDYLPAERTRGITIQSAAITFGWRDTQLHLIDTPGHVDFTVEVERAMRVLDGAVTIIDAVAGVQAQTQTVWKQAARYGIPRIAFINKMDRDGADWRKCVAHISHKLSATPLVLYTPLADTSNGERLEGSALECWVDVVNMQIVKFDIANDNTGSTVSRSAIGADNAEAAHARAALVEALAEVDERLLEIFLDDVDGDAMRVPAHEMAAAIRRATLASRACPVLLGASFRNVGVQPLLDAIVDYLPSPLDRPAPTGIVPAEQMKNKLVAHKEMEVALTAQSKLVAFAFKVIVDAQRGPMVFVRVYSGTLDARSTVVNSTRGTKERASKLLQMYADHADEITSIACGHIGVVLGLKHTKTGDTLVHASHPSLSKKAIKAKHAAAGPVGIQLHGISVPSPVFFCAVEANSPQDEKSVSDTLANLLLEDPSLHISHDSETGQTLLSGMGELHLEIVRDRMINDLKVNASFGDMRVAYREAAGNCARASFVYAKDVAGTPAKAAMTVEVSQCDSDENTVEVTVPDTIASARSPEHAAEIREMMATAVSDGLHNAANRGTLLGFPVQRTRIVASDVEFFGEELSTPAAYRACAAHVFALALEASMPVLLEPIARVVITCPESNVGGVMSDLSSVRRGRVVGMGDAEDAGFDSQNVVKSVVAEVPLSSMVGYSSVLRSLTAGSGTFTMEVERFGQMSAAQQQLVIKETRGY